ncbi:MAG: AraC family transcriptional regulator [Thermoanaerobaculia bacterium]|nr:AraC family transcriptional regulator [Thermoanaerobaculia bacterium]
MATSGILIFIGLFGSLQAWLLAAATWWGGRRDEVQRGQARLLALLFVILGLVVAIVSVDHAGWLDRTVPLDWIEYSLSLLAPTMFLGYAHRIVGRDTSPTWWCVHFIPLAVWFAWTLQEHRVWPNQDWPPIALIVAYQIAYTLRGAMLAFPGPKTGGTSNATGLTLLRAWIVGFSMVHVAQLVRLAFRHVDALEQVVPVTATVALYGLVLFALRSARLLQPSPPPYAGSGLAPDAVRDAAAHIETILADERLFLDPDLDLGALAARAGLSRAHASQAINQSLGLSFHDLVNRHRVNTARDLLDDPDHDHVTIDAVGQRAGFASRSSYYEAFRRHAGSTPGRYRADRGN